MRLEVTEQYRWGQPAKNIDFVLGFLFLVPIVNYEQYINWLFGFIDDHGLPEPSID